MLLDDACYPIMRGPGKLKFLMHFADKDYRERIPLKLGVAYDGRSFDYIFEITMLGLEDGMCERFLIKGFISNFKGEKRTPISGYYSPNENKGWFKIVSKNNWN